MRLILAALAGLLILSVPALAQDHPYQISVQEFVTLDSGPGALYRVEKIGHWPASHNPFITHTCFDAADNVLVTGRSDVIWDDQQETLGHLLVSLAGVRCEAFLDSAWKGELTVVSETISYAVP